jgi:hypothetical protein
MSIYKKIEKLKESLEKELNKPEPNLVEVNKLRTKIIIIGMELKGRDIKPF